MKFGESFIPHSVRLVRLLERGYFPKELPPPFFTSQFAGYIERNDSIVPSHPSGDKHKALISRSVVHNLVRPGGLRRLLQIPNPFSQFTVSNIIAKNWDKVQKQLGKSTISVSKPIDDSADLRAFATENPSRELPAIRARNRSTARFILRADVNRFYGSIYSHSIPWVLEGKATAKKEREKGFGNELDRAIRNSQDGQTLGIPIGTDTSLVIAELILAAIDEQIAPVAISGFRYMDDYELAFTDRASAESGLAKLQTLLQEIELGLNAQKTRIDALPVSLDRQWALSVKNFRFMSQQTISRRDLIEYFNHIFLVAAQHKFAAVIPYAISLVKLKSVESDDWSLLQDLLCQCILTDSACLKYAMIIFENNRGLLDTATLEETVNAVLIAHGPLAHGSEVAWALWAAIWFSLKIDEEAAHIISGFYDPIVVLLALHARNQGAIGKGLDIKPWLDRITSEELYGNLWLLAYEAHAQGWLAPDKKHVDDDPNYGPLKKAGIKFFNPDVTEPVRDASQLEYLEALKWIDTDDQEAPS